MPAFFFSSTASFFNSPTEDTGHYIQSITVDRLFGRYTYSIPANDEQLSELSILYGKNGAGKTTLLTLVFHLLSPSDNKGHSNSISKIPFNKLQVTLADGTLLSAEKDPQLLVGPVTFKIQFPQKSAITWNFSPSSSGESFRVEDLPENVDLSKLPSRIRAEVKRSLEQRQFFAELAKLRMKTFFLTSDRLLLGDSVNEVMRSDSRYESGRNRVKNTAEILIEHRVDFVNKALTSAAEWVRSKFIEQSYTIQSSADPYLDVVNKIIDSKYKTSGGINKSQETEIRQMLTTKIQTLSEKLEEFSKFGLITATAPTSLIQSIDSASGNKLNLIKSILEPHLNGLLTKTTNLQPLYNLINRFINSVNEFFQDKWIEFNIVTGFTIRVNDSNNGRNQDLSPNQLSSGEQQIILLLCHALITRDNPSIFIIDEPEISLNILWQRILVSRLQDLSQGANIQFLLASHSMEILAKHRNRVISMGEA